MPAAKEDKKKLELTQLEFYLGVCAVNTIRPEQAMAWGGNVLHGTGMNVWVYRPDEEGNGQRRILVRIPDTIQVEIIEEPEPEREPNLKVAPIPEPEPEPEPEPKPEHTHTEPALTVKATGAADASVGSRSSGKR